MKIITGIFFLLCTLMNSFTMRTQEDSVKKPTSCVPIKEISKHGVTFQAGERMDFTMHYEWGVIDSDIGTATVTWTP